ncbi:addiction module antitoxin, RelB/DinJ family [Fusobacterium equinum]|uniref:Addiction module antitoxin, RelB/DinJ family n=1 Tax=Fusobacterium equinum TaxID=134605 RepID=A0A133NHI2_9FUSO|nr:type II toxin-antitoxin system RelB/DinJ family antitoxin [Fusobacterium equinum]KXA15755.1 addiction module antitoxin, RelB/DinJ family [Fusobacterium equinum]
MAVINVRVDETMKKEVETLYKELGLNMSTAINLFLKKCLLEQGLPFELKLPNKKTMEVIQDIEQGDGLSKEFDSIDELLNDLHV